MYSNDDQRVYLNCNLMTKRPGDFCRGGGGKINIGKQNCSSPVKIFVDRPESYSATHGKTVYLLRRISFARFELNFSIFLLCQVKIPDEK